MKIVLNSFLFCCLLLVSAQNAHAISTRPQPPAQACSDLESYLQLGATICLAAGATPIRDQFDDAQMCVAIILALDACIDIQTSKVAEKFKLIEEELAKKN